MIVSKRYMIKAALKQDTTLSRAMLRACGVPVPEPDRYACYQWTQGAARAHIRTHSHRVSREVLECFRNTTSPLDGRIPEVR